MVAKNDEHATPASALPPEKGIAETPESLADALVTAVGIGKTDNWLDPCAGSGRLVTAAIRAGVPRAAILAIDLQICLPMLEGIGVESLLGTDFLRWAQETDRRFERVIANPPFVRLRELDESLHSPALEIHLNGIGVPGTANYWMPFLLAGMRLLRSGGSLGYILPAAWEYADYATALREMCVGSFKELDVHRVSLPMFDEVGDGSVMLVGRGFGNQVARHVRVIRHATLPALNKAVREGDFRVATVGSMREADGRLPEDQVRFGQIARIGIGAVTGDARFFLLNESQRLELDLPRSSVRPILSKAQHIVGSEIDEETWDCLLLDGNRIWLFDPAESDLADPAVRAYLDLPVEVGGCQRDAAKIRGRVPWYRVWIPDQFDGFMTGMSQTAPWVALNRMPTLTASNTLYGVRFRSIPSVEERASWCLSMLSSTTLESRARLVREYPQGLLKLEPRDMARLAVRRPKTTARARMMYQEATSLIMRGHPEDARAMADEWLDLPGGAIGPQVIADSRAFRAV